MKINKLSRSQSKRTHVCSVRLSIKVVQQIPLLLVVFVVVFYYRYLVRMQNALLLPPTKTEEDTTSAASSFATTNATAVYEVPSPIVKEDVSFPPECTWQCYLQQNKDLLKTFRWNETKAIQHYQRYGAHENRNCACKILILAGPHKTASTSLQTIATVYSKMNNIKWHWLFKQNKGFAPFPKTFYGDAVPQIYFPNLYSNGQVPTFDTLKEQARDELRTKYNEGYNIMLGSEEIDHVTKANNISNNNTIIDEIINILPNKSQEYIDKHISSLVVYRAPRSAHLKSLWVQLQKDQKMLENKQASSFKDFICSKGVRGIGATIFAIDSLALTKIMLKKGIRVKLFDMTSLDNSNGRSLTSMLGCDVMGLSCIQDEETNHIIPVVIHKHRRKRNIMKTLIQHRNIKSGYNDKIDISNEQFMQIDEIMNKYDCAQYAEIMEYKDKFELLFYDNKSMFNEYMMKCKSYSDFLTSHDQMVQSIKALVGCD